MGVGNQGSRRKYSRRGTARPAPKGQFVDPDTGVRKFLEPGQPRGTGKRRFKGEVVRRAYNGKGELLRKNRQEAEVFAHEAEAAGLIARHCPDPWPGMEAAETTCNVYFQPA